MSLTALCAPRALAAETVSNGVTPTFDEAFYATLDYYGNLQDASVVKSYSMNGVSTLTDYGTYDSVTNLTDGTVPVVTDGQTTFDFTDTVPDHFYFEGKTSAPFEKMPWKITVSYLLNGVPAKAEELEGKTGVVDIQLDLVPNADASDYAKNNYTLEAAAIFNQNDILSLKADGAQVQLVGNLRVVLFLALPGEERHFTIEVGADQFEFDGMTFLMAPATLAQLDDIAELSDDKDDIEKDYKKLDGSLDTLLDSMEDMSGSLRSAASGLDELNTARGTVSSGKGDVYAGADKAISDLGALGDALSALPDHLDTASSAVTDVTDDLTELTKTAVGLKSDLNAVKADLSAVQNDLDDVKKDLSGGRDSLQDDLDDLGSGVSALQSDVTTLQSTLSQLNLQIGGSGITFNGMTPDEINASVKKIDGLNTVYQMFGGGGLSETQFLEAALIASGQASTIDGAQAILTAAPADPANPTAAEIAAARKAALLKAIYAAAAGDDASMSETEFVAAMLMAGDQTADGAKTYLATAQQAMQLYQLSKSTLGEGLLNDLSDLCDAAGKDGLSGDLSDLTAETSDAIGDLSGLSGDAQAILTKVNALLDQVQTLDDTVNRYVPDLKTALSDTKTVVTASSSALSDTSGFLTSFESLLKKAGTQLDAGAKDSLSGLSSTLRKAADSIDTTEDVRSAKNSISDIITDEWDKHTGDKDNLLNTDSEAPAVSLTSEKNPTPQSVQILLRTQEIKIPDDDTEEEQQAAASSRTFWQRVVDMFQGIGSAVVSAFRR